MAPYSGNCVFGLFLLLMCYWTCNASGGPPYLHHCLKYFGSARNQLMHSAQVVLHATFQNWASTHQIDMCLGRSFGGEQRGISLINWNSIYFLFLIVPENATLCITFKYGQMSTFSLICFSACFLLWPASISSVAGLTLY